MSRRPLRDRVRDILDAIGEIREFTRGMDASAFAADAKTVKAVTAEFAIIGEAARNLPAEVVAAHPEIPWLSMRDMRNVVVHAYFSVEPAILWETIEKDLPAIVVALRALLADPLAS